MVSPRCIDESGRMLHRAPVSVLRRVRHDGAGSFRGGRMQRPDAPSRRTLMKLAGSGFALGTVAKLAPREAAAEPLAGNLWTGEYTAKKRDVSLYMFRKRAG